MSGKKGRTGLSNTQNPSGSYVEWMGDCTYLIATRSVGGDDCGFTTNAYYLGGSGTSEANPMVAAVCALWADVAPWYDSYDIQGFLRDTAYKDIVADHDISEARPYPSIWELDNEARPAILVKLK